MRVMWDLNESIVLLDGLTAVQEKILPRSQAILSVSQELRQYAMNRGQTIDSIFRNRNGINMQMSVMEWGFTDGKAGFRNSNVARVFEEAIELYRTDHDKFSSDLLQVRADAQDPSCSSDFFAYLKNRAENQSQYLSFLNACENLNIQIAQTGLLKENDLFNCLSLVTVARIQKRLFPADASGSLTRREETMKEILSIYYDFLLDRLLERQKTGETTPVQFEPVRQSMNCLDFASLPSVSSIPLYGTFKADKKEMFRTWNEVYAWLLRTLIANHPEMMKRLAVKGSSGDEDPGFTDSSGALFLKQPVEVEPGFYMEANGTPAEFLGRIGALMKTDHAVTDQFEVWYFEPDLHVHFPEKVKVDSFTRNLVNHRKEQFIQYAIQKGNRSGTVQKDIENLEEIGKIFVDKGKMHGDLFILANGWMLRRQFKRLLNDADSSVSTQQNKEWSASMDRYCQFLDSMSEEEKKKTKKAVDSLLASAKKTAEQS